MSGFPVQFTKQAEDDLISIWRYIANESPQAADRVLDRINSRCQGLAAHPYSGPPREEIAAGVRHLAIDGYLTLYRVRNEQVEILRVLHGARNIDDINVPD
ncbi:type II toxin-antitoxin system RelE/ParE family toxin [Terrarubrum flagellatum]|uniref:type II toxin-antitoxin system RelE/ParE family toxin n=1 Tax=Terrirubrum flagellatum TaxID=2895980 RepID=UPI003145074F